MKIGIIGSGKMGLSLGKLWAEKGHSIFFSDLLPDAAKAAADAINCDAGHGTIVQAVDFGDALLLAVPYPAVFNALEFMAGDSIVNGKILIDCTNPLSQDYKSLLVGHNISAAEEIAELVSKSGNVRVVKAFNTIASPVFESGDTSFGKDRATMFYCGDDEAAKSLVSKLIADTGFEPVDAGPLINARFLEPLAALIIQLAVSQEMGTNIALKLLKR